MNPRLIAVILAIAAVSAGAQAQTPSSAKATKTDAQKVVEMISHNKAKTAARSANSRPGGHQPGRREAGQQP